MSERIHPARELESLPAFSEVGEAERKEIGRRLAVRRVRKGEVVQEAGKRVDRFHAFVRGWVKLTMPREGGGETILGVYPPPLFPGVAPYFAGRPSVVSFVAMQDCVVLECGTAEFQRILADFPQVARGFNRYLATSFLEHTQRFHLVRVGRVERRLARLLATLADRHGVRESDGVAVHIPITRQELADTVDATVSTVIRQMRAWEKEGVIACRRGRIAVRKPAALHALAGAEAP